MASSQITAKKRPLREGLDTRAQALRLLQEIPGIGPKMAADLYGLGIRKIGDLKGKDPEKLFRAHERQVGCAVDRCVLYTFRCAVYYAQTRRRNPELLKWWNWKD